MGYSATRAAFQTLDRIREHVGAEISNGLPGGFYEIGAEQDSGAIVGEVFKHVGDGIVRYVGDFCVSPDGAIKKMPLLDDGVIRELNAGDRPAFTVGTNWRLGAARISYRPDWSRPHPFATYYAGRGGRIFKSLGEAMHYLAPTRPSSAWERS